MPTIGAQLLRTQLDALATHDDPTLVERASRAALAILASYGLHKPAFQTPRPASCDACHYRQLDRIIENLHNPRYGN